MWKTLILVPIRIIILYDDNDESHMSYHKPLLSFLWNLTFFDENYHKRSTKTDDCLKYK